MKKLMLIKFLLENGVDVNSKCVGMDDCEAALLHLATPLHIATAFSANMEVIKLLVQ